MYAILVERPPWATLYYGGNLKRTGEPTWGETLEWARRYSSIDSARRRLASLKRRGGAMGAEADAIEEEEEEFHGLG